MGIGSSTTRKSESVLRILATRRWILVLMQSCGLTDSVQDADIGLQAKMTTMMKMKCSRIIKTIAQLIKVRKMPLLDAIIRWVMISIDSLVKPPAALNKI